MATGFDDGTITKEEFEQLPDAFKRFEVEYGKLVEVEPVGNYGSLLEGRIAYYFFLHLGDPGSTEVLTSTARFRLRREPKDLIRGCDVAYVPKERMPGGRPDEHVGDYVPALAVEIISESNRARKVAAKIKEWFDAGVGLLWVIYPDEQWVYVYTSPTSCRILQPGDVLDGGSLLPGLEIPLATLFA